MVLVTVCTALVILISTTGTWSFQWTGSGVQSGSTVRVCGGQRTVDLVWSYATDSSEHDNDIQWTFRKNGDLNETLLASVFRGHFFIEPQIHQHISFLPPSGIHLADVTSEDTGVYIIKVTVSQLGSLVTHTTHVNLRIAEPPILVHNALHVTRVPDIIYDNATGHWHVLLSCGTFSFLGSTPVHVVVKTPDGRVLTNTPYENGHFTVTLPNPVVTGDYTCQIANPQDTCLPFNSPLLAPATVHVTGCNLQLDVTSAELAALKTENEKLRTETQRLESQVTSQQSRITSLESTNHELIRRNSELLLNLQQESEKSSTLTTTMTARTALPYLPLGHKCNMSVVNVCGDVSVTCQNHQALSSATTPYNSTGAEEGTCVCSENYYQSYQFYTCLPRLHYNESCVYGDDSSDVLRQCLGSLTACKPLCYDQDGNPSFLSLGTCVCVPDLTFNGTDCTGDFQ